MKYGITVFSALLICTSAQSQTHPKQDSKHTTVVDSVNAPPRMDGNTGKYDTVKHPPKSRKKTGNKKPTNVDYNINKEKITTQPAR